MYVGRNKILRKLYILPIEIVVPHVEFHVPFELVSFGARGWLLEILSYVDLRGYGRFIFLDLRTLDVLSNVSKSAGQNKYLSTEHA